jgi:serine/threonine-protein kinase HipA
MRQGQVFYKNELAGLIQETDEGFTFQYDSEYLLNKESKPISLTLPLQQMAYCHRILFPFFDGLIPEGWLLNIAADNWKINKNDRMGLLLACCKNTVGAVSVHPINENDND